MLSLFAQPFRSWCGFVRANDAFAPELVPHHRAQCDAARRRCRLLDHETTFLIPAPNDIKLSGERSESAAARC